MSETKLNVAISRCRITPGARDHLDAHDVSSAKLVARHLLGDWGSCDEEDAAANDHAVETGARTLGVYAVGGQKVWVMADASLSETQSVRLEGHLFAPRERYALTVLLPDEY